MILRTLALATVLLCSSTAAYAAVSDHSRDPKTLKVHKDKDKDKEKDKSKEAGKARSKDASGDTTRVAVSVPDADPSAALLMIIGTSTVWALARGRRQEPNLSVQEVVA